MVHRDLSRCQKRVLICCGFTGTLMNVDILCRVIGSNPRHLMFADALLEVLDAYFV